MNDRKPDFLVIGAQKSGTSWIWDKLRQHPGTDLPARKEIHYFGGVENYRQGPDWYYAHFAGCDSARITGEASTSYLYDRMPYWFNASDRIEYDEDLAPIPEVVHDDLPEAKIVAILRDPVYRAISAYRHWLKQRQFSPLSGLERAAVAHPKTRILEYGDYAQHLAPWIRVYGADRVLVLVFERDVARDPAAGLRRLYGFLGIDSRFTPPSMGRNVHRSWSWTRSAVSYYAGPLRKLVDGGRVGRWLDRADFLGRFALRESDIRFLRDRYLPQKPALEALLGERLELWDYGARLPGGEGPVVTEAAGDERGVTR